MSSYGENFEKGMEFQDFVMLTLQKRGLYVQIFSSKKYQYSIGESFQGIEIKLDREFMKYGRLSIEIAEKTKAENKIWVPSGIYRNDNTWLYVQGNENIFYVFMKHQLITLHKSGKFETGESFGTIRKFYLPIERADKIGYKFLAITPAPSA